MASASLGFDGAGKRIRVDVYGATKAEALKKLDAAKQNHLTRDRVSVADYCQSWLKRVEGSVELGTWRQYEQHVRIHITPRLGAIRLAKLSPENAAAFVSRMKREEVSAAMVKKVVYTFRTILGTAVTARIIPTDPTAGIPLPKHHKPEPRVLNPAEVGAILTAVDSDRLRAGFFVAIDGGLRQGELFALRWSDIDMATGGVSITRSMADRKGEFKEKPVKTRNGRRRVVLDFARPALESHRQRMIAEGQDVTTGFVFCTAEGGALRKAWFSTHVFKPTKKAAKIPDLTFHGIRHSSSTLALLAGVDTKIVSSRLGHHSSGFTANTYQHVLAGMQERAAGGDGRSSERVDWL